MSDHKSTPASDADNKDDSDYSADALAAVGLIAAFAFTCLYWIANQ